MKSKRLQAAVLLLLAASCSVGWTDERMHEHDRRGDPRFHHDHFYPARGAFVHVLPLGFFPVAVAGASFFYFGGVWYRHHLDGYIVVDAPPFAYVPVLPPDYTVVTVGPTPYYYANGAYYIASPNNGYQVVPPPPGVVPPAPVPVPVPMPAQETAPLPVHKLPAGDGLFVYPRKNQTPLQAANDRHDCDHWGQAQTGYDFERPGQANPDALPDFQRAVSACLDARGYTVR